VNKRLNNIKYKIRPPHPEKHVTAKHFFRKIFFIVFYKIRPPHPEKHVTAKQNNKKFDLLIEIAVD